MKVLFAGYGSIARRHIQNLSDICRQKEEKLEVDLLRYTSSDVPEGVQKVFTSADLIDADYDAVFITNPTAAHYETLLALLDRSDFFFIEKPVFDRSDVDIAPLLRTDKFFHVACPLRFTNVIQWVRDNVPYDSILGVRCISSSYLPDWRPSIDYRQTYSAHAEMGGGVEIDLIHEFDYVCSLLGLPTSVKSIMGKVSNLEIDSNDIALYIADFGGKTAEVHVDYYGRYPIRRMEVFTLEDTYVCDLLESRVFALKSGETIDFGEVRNDFQLKEMRYFVECMSSHSKPVNGIEEAIRVLGIVKGDEF